MADKDNQGKKSIAMADKDYGLPEVKITPLLEKEKPGFVPNNPKDQKLETVLKGKEHEAAGSEKKRFDKEPSITEPIAEKNKAVEAPVKKKEKSNKWAWVTILFVFILISLGAVWVWYYNEGNVTEEPEMITAIEEPEEVAPLEEEVGIEDEPEQEAEIPVLTRIQSRAASPRYFVVVGSFIDEDMALDYSARLNRQNKNTYLVYPYGEIAFYRLAIGEFETLSQAVELLEQNQANFKENLWVLKY